MANHLTPAELADQLQDGTAGGDREMRRDGRPDLPRPDRPDPVRDLAAQPRRRPADTATAPAALNRLPRDGGEGYPLEDAGGPVAAGRGALRRRVRPCATRTATAGSTAASSEVLEIVRPLALGLAELGVEKGDRVSILGNTRPEWTYFDFAALSIGATVVPIYQTNSPDECRYVLENSDAKVVVVEDEEQLAKVREVRDRLPQLEQVVLMVGDADDAISIGRARRQRRRRRRGPSGSSATTAVTSDDICTFIYTSGTTGPPKGCMISHGNYRSMLDMVNETSVIEDGGRHLPLPAPRPLLRPADPARQLRPRDDDRLLGGRPAQDPAQPGRTETDLLPLGAAHLREDLHRRQQRHGKRGRR